MWLHLNCAKSVGLLIGGRQAMDWISSICLAALALQSGTRTCILKCLDALGRIDLSKILSGDGNTTNIMLSATIIVLNVPTYRRRCSSTQCHPPLHVLLQRTQLQYILYSCRNSHWPLLHPLSQPEILPPQKRNWSKAHLNGHLPRSSTSAL
ncbi:hypothetical protein HDV57DRAFT_323889 [Trichoderma longibrachiatum]